MHHNRIRLADLRRRFRKIQPLIVSAHIPEIIQALGRRHNRTQEHDNHNIATQSNTDRLSHADKHLYDGLNIACNIIAPLSPHQNLIFSLIFIIYYIADSGEIDYADHHAARDIASILFSSEKHGINHSKDHNASQIQGAGSVVIVLRRHKNPRDFLLIILRDRPVQRLQRCRANPCLQQSKIGENLIDGGQ